MVHLLVAMLAFAFFAISGLVIDLGMTRMSQDRMAGAADSGAVEGIRLSDASDDTARREAARGMLRSNFAYDFAAGGGGPIRFGAGPDVSVVGGVGSMDALGTVSVAPSVVYVPDPELNLGDADHGDMVGGFVDVYDGTSPMQVEASDYARADFSTVADPSLDEGFLVRLRRTPGTNPLDEEAGVASRGSALPYLFGRGSTLAPAARARGISVRATAIAAARRATTVGPSNVPADLVGAPVFALEFDYWNGIPVDSDFVLRFGQGNGNNAGGNGNGGGNGNAGGNGNGGGNGNAGGNGGGVGGPPIVPPGQIQGQSNEPLRGVFVDRSALPRKSWSIGDEVDPAEDWTNAELLALLGNPDQPGYTPRTYYVPIYEGNIGLVYDGRPGFSNPPFLPPVNNLPKDTMPPRIVGFGTIRVLSVVEDAAGSGNANGNGNGNGTWTITIRKSATLIAPTNASAVETPGLAGLSPSITETVLDLLSQVDQSVRAAAIAR